MYIDPDFAHLNLVPNVQSSMKENSMTLSNNKQITLKEKLALPVTNFLSTPNNNESYSKIPQYKQYSHVQKQSSNKVKNLEENLSPTSNHKLNNLDNEPSICNLVLDTKRESDKINDSSQNLSQEEEKENIDIFNNQLY